MRSTRNSYILICVDLRQPSNQGYFPRASPQLLDRDREDFAANVYASSRGAGISFENADRCIAKLVQMIFLDACDQGQVLKADIFAMVKQYIALR